MKVLWITNILFPEAKQLITGTGSLKASGGWLLGAAEAVVGDGKNHLTVAAPSALVQGLKLFRGEKIDYYVLPLGKGNKNKNIEYDKCWAKIETDLQPDVVHIYGTELSHGLSYINTCSNDKVVISIQGLTSAYAQYYNQGLSFWDILSNITFRDLVEGTLFGQKREFRKRGEYEIEMLQKVNHIIGRTSWDKSYAWAYNPNATYHHCDETLRSEFYEGEWKYEQCVPYTIFVSQCHYPIKGLHQLLKAMPLILRSYPDTKIVVAGGGAVNMHFSFYEWIKRTGYRKYLYKLIKRLSLDNCVQFLGPLDAHEMKEQLLNSNVFVCPSSIENSPNSLGEAQLLGVPCISSYVGGTMDMMHGDEQNLYRFEEIEMLAKKVCDIFAQGGEYDSRSMQVIARKRHNPKNNVAMLEKIYYSIIEQNKTF